MGSAARRERVSAQIALDHMEKTRILIVEDEAPVVRLLTLRLQDFGYEVVGAVAQGEQAIGEVQHTRPDLVLMDIRISGGMDGIEAATILQQDYGVPVIFLTSHADDATLERAERAGAYGYVLKPFQGREVHAMIRLALTRHAQSQKIVSTLREAQRASAALRDTLGQASTQMAGTDSPDLLAEFQTALAKGALQVYYQPCVALRSGAIVGVEALLRWDHPRRGLLLPFRLLPLAEDGSFAAAIDQWVAEQAIAQAKPWVKRHPGLKLMLNINPGHFHRGELRAWMAQLLRRWTLAPGNIELDIAESIFFQGGRSLTELGELKSMGLRLAIDDFGIGYSVIPRLPALQIDAVKIHPSFVHKALAGENSAAVMQALIQLSTAAGLDTIMEGVETAEQACLLREQGCGAMQGYLFSAPVSAEAFERMLVQGKRLQLPEGAPQVPQVQARAAETDEITVEQQEIVERLIEERTRALRESNAELEAFAYTVSHDLRAPLRAIIGFATMLGDQARDRLDEEQNRILDRVLQAGGRMWEQIDALLALSRLARQEVKLVDVDLSAMAEEVLADSRRAVASEKLEAKIAPGLRVRADPSLMRIVLQNLFGNALKYSMGRPVISVEFGEVDTPRGRAFCISDNGAGFNPAQADRLFGVFQRLHAQSEFSGNGVGLASVKRIVLRHGGEVWAESEPGSGARFYFTLPTQAS